MLPRAAGARRSATGGRAGGRAGGGGGGSLQTPLHPLHHAREHERARAPDAQELEAQGLPPGWTRAWDAASDAYYFARPGTGEATWEWPAPPPPPPPPPPAEEPAAAEPAAEGCAARRHGGDAPADAAERDAEWTRRASAKASMHPARIGRAAATAAVVGPRAGAGAGASTPARALPAAPPAAAPAPAAHPGAASAPAAKKGGKAGASAVGGRKRPVRPPAPGPSAARCAPWPPPRIPPQPRAPRPHAPAAPPSAPSPPPPRPHLPTAADGALRVRDRPGSQGGWDGGLVDRWNAARAEAAAAELVEAEQERPRAGASYEELDAAKRRRLDEWRAQLGGDELGANANFRPLPGDWRARAQRARHGGAAGQESGEACASRLE